jgi:acetolactate synthase-1/2/3 large subunit
MNGAELLLDTLVASGVEVCFSNPGTSEMHLVSAIGNNDRMRNVLCLFEGVVSGAADGYARMADKPALTLLHLGSGYSNSMANLHNAKRAHTPVVNIVGDHATYHLQYDTALTSDITAHAKICSDWVKVTLSADDLARSGAEAVNASLQGSGKIATLIAPANHAWEEATGEIKPPASSELSPVPDSRISKAAEALSSGKPTALLLGGKAFREESLRIAGRISAATGVRILGETFAARLQRGAGRFAVERLQYFAEHACEQLAGLEQIILVGTAAPVSFFAYPGKKSWLAPDGCEVICARKSRRPARCSNGCGARRDRTAVPRTRGAPDTRCHWPEPDTADAGGRHCFGRGSHLRARNLSGDRKRSAA